MNDTEALVVRSPEQLAVVAGLRPFRPLTTAKRLSLQLPSVHASLQHPVERRLNFWLGICGCKSGGLLLLAALVWQIGINSRVHAWTFKEVLLAVGWILTAGVTGKVVALLIARAVFIAEITLFLRGSATMNERPSHGL
jgi:hypothetical protein